MLAVPKDHEDFFDSIAPYRDKHDLSALDWVIQHALVVTPDQMRLFAEMGLKFTTCVGFEWGKGDLWRERIGEHVLKNMIPLNRYLKEGVTVGCGTDWGPKNIFEQMQLAITHELAASGYRNQTPDHVVTREQSLLMWTREAARSLSWEKVGILVPGNYADVTIVDRNPLSCPIDELPQTKVMRTILGGETVYDSGDL